MSHPTETTGTADFAPFFDAAVRGMDSVGHRTWTGIVREHARRRPGSTAINFDGQEQLTYGELERASSSLAAALSAQGFSKGDVVGIVAGTCLEYPVILMAVHRLGGVIVPLSTRLTPEEIAYQLGHARARFIVADAEHADVARAWADRQGMTFVATDKAAVRGRCSDVRYLMSLGDVLDDVPTEPSDLATIMFTSGSTGHPKGVLLSHGNYVHNSEVLKRLYGYGPSDVGLSFFPLCHQNGHNYQLVTWLTAGAEVVLVPRFSASRFSEQLVEFGATITSVISTHVNMILTQPPSSADRSHCLRMAKFGMNLERDRFFAFEERFGVELRGSYSQTELIGPVTFNPLEGLRKVESIGIPVLGVDVRIIDDQGRDLPAGVAGELLVRPASRHGVCIGYLGEEGSPANLLENGWWRTLDIARFDEDGFIHFAGRVKDMIKRGGFNVAAAEVERVLEAHPAVAEASVIGVPDPVRDEAIVALIVLEENADSTEADELSRFCAERLADYKVPEVFEMVTALPRTDVGKVDKRRCRELFASRSQGVKR